MKTIEIGGKQRPVLFGINALAEFNQATGTDFAWIFKIIENPFALDFNQLRWLVYTGLKQGAEESGKDIDFTIKDVGNWLNDDFDKFPEFTAELADSMPKMESKGKNPEAPVKGQ